MQNTIGVYFGSVQMQKKDTKRSFETMKQSQQISEEMASQQSATHYGDDRYDDQSSSSSISDEGSDQDWASPTDAKKGRLGQGYGVMCSEASSANCLHMSGHPETSMSYKPAADDDRRKVRRERNKQAAARCRQKRVDLTNSLIAETEALENEKIKLEREIETLYRQTHELQFVLESHSKRCQMMTNCCVKSNFSDSLTTPVDLTAVKVEKPDTKANFGSMTAKLGMGRPTSLPIRSSIATPSMNTPFSGSTGIPCSLTLDFMADGHTGLTPLTGLPSAAEVPLSAQCLGPNHSLINL